MINQPAFTAAVAADRRRAAEGRAQRSRATRTTVFHEPAHLWTRIVRWVKSLRPTPAERWAERVDPTAPSLGLDGPPGFWQ